MVKMTGGKLCLGEKLQMNYKDHWRHCCIELLRCSDSCDWVCPCENLGGKVQRVIRDSEFL